MPETTARPQRNALVGQVIDLLRENISNGRWEVGARIPTESELATAYGVSRVTLRQAVQALVHVGQLETIQGNGTFVRATTEIEAVVGRYLASEELRPVLELRQALESHAAALAAERASIEDVDAMRAAVAAGASAMRAGDHDGTTRASAQFHRAIVEASGNPPLIALYSALQHSVLETIQRTRSKEGPQSFVDGHARILEAIENGDARTAHELADAHLTPVLDVDLRFA
ncbi:FadR family transcriptional regulator [Nocardioides sp. BGMRC 2183]|nr:FadR family transcriptional regulator [Nocardioides sp. BGMRC 2183]